ncbi:MAG: metalloprotease, partial [Bacteroidota bacterium]
KYLKKSGLYVSNYRISASTSHFQVNSRFASVTPSISFGWRPADLISNKRQFLTFRYVNIFRNFDESVEDLSNDPDNPDYSVFNARFSHSNNGIIDFDSWSADFQQASNFTKLVLEFEYRKLFDNNTQFNVRFFGGAFLRNRLEEGNRFFDFALDRPTDYLFDYNYLGRSEDTGIYSQQIIIAEGGFKSFLDERYRFANQWLTTMNTSVNLWRWIEAYGDLGLVKNRGQRAKFVYDSGIRLNLVTDFFELYFPVYSNNGWEITQPDYEERIRFIITISPRTLTGLFTRKWF